MSLRKIQILVDTSASMAGTQVIQARNFIDSALLECLRAHPARYGALKLDLCVFDSEVRALCRDVTLDFFDTSPLSAESGSVAVVPGGPSLARPLVEHIKAESGGSEPSPGEVLYLLVGDGQFLDDSSQAFANLSFCASPRLAFGVDGASTPSLALFEHWPHARIRVPGEASSTTSQDLDRLLSIA